MLFSYECGSLKMVKRKHHGDTLTDNDFILDLNIDAMKGDPVAMEELSCAYRMGSLVDIDNEKAFSLRKKAASLGFQKSQLQLGLQYLTGDQVEQDIEQATYWLKKSADQADTISMINLIEIYAEGYGLKVDNIEAYKWVLIVSRLDKGYAIESDPWVQEIAEKLGFEGKLRSEYLANLWFKNYWTL